MTAPGGRAPVPSRCVGCGSLAPAGQPLCAGCVRILNHVCYGKTPHYPATARTIAERERLLPGKESTVAYDCPVCDTHHTGRSSPGGRAVYADAVLICLKLRRFHGHYLARIAADWRPGLADRERWRRLVSPHRFTDTRKEAPRDDRGSAEVPAA